MKTSVSAGGSKSSSKAADSGSFKHCAVPSSPPRMPLPYLNFRDNGRYSMASAGRGHNVNFLQKNRQACSRNSSEMASAGLSPQRPKIGHAPKIGDALGTPSNKGSSSFMSAGHYGIRDPEFKVGYKKRHHLDF